MHSSAAYADKTQLLCFLLNFHCLQKGKKWALTSGGSHGQGLHSCWAPDSSQDKAGTSGLSPDITWGEGKVPGVCPQLTRDPWRQLFLSGEALNAGL